MNRDSLFLLVLPLVAIVGLSNNGNGTREFFPFSCRF